MNAIYIGILYEVCTSENICHLCCGDVFSFPPAKLQQPQIVWLWTLGMKQDNTTTLQWAIITLGKNEWMFNDTTTQK